MSEIKITVGKYLTVRGNGWADTVLQYLPEGSFIRYVEQAEPGGRFTAIAKVEVTQDVTRTSPDEVVANLEARLDYLLGIAVDRLASGLYGAVVTDEPDMDAW